ncbi:MAG: phage tail sheath subtilisin-like domain-containing protein, partial [Planctomycetes bacterium]|nr:phage tail sheath subtilisin-like domain-containing protein [Planctomycetota bacterium]
MAKEYLRPGVFVEEIPSGAFPIEGVGTTTAAFVGIAARGALNSPRLITNWTQFQKHFGSYRRDSFLAYAVNGFFLNGGRRCYVARVASATAAIASVTLKDRESGTPLDTLLVQALNEGEWGNALTVDVADGTADSAGEFKLVVKEDGEVVETWDDLSMDPAKKNYALTRVNGRSNYIQLSNLNSVTAPPANRPAVIAGAALAGGADGAADITDTAFIGDAAARTGLHALDTVDDVNNLVIPGKTSTAIVQAGLDYCAGRADLGYVMDPPLGSIPQDVKAFREGFDSSYGFLYYPWLSINDPLTDAPKTVPPSGYVAGIYARSDTERGVHKAPANEVVRGAIGLQFQVSKSEQDSLNPDGINCIRTFPGRGIRVWGARTVSSDPAWRYINVRRLFNFVEESIEQGTQWVVFEPNDRDLWERVKRDITAFLTRVWRDGAL